MVGESIEELYERYGAVVFRRARMLLGDEQAAWDALQEVFVRVLRGGGAFRNQSSPMTWLYRITTNYCFNVVRDGTRLRDRHLAQAAERPLMSAEDPELRLTLSQLLSLIPEELCEIAVYYHVDRMSHDEIAQVVGVSRRTVGNRLKEFQTRAQGLWGQPVEGVA